MTRPAGLGRRRLQPLDRVGAEMSKSDLHAVTMTDGPMHVKCGGMKGPARRGNETEHEPQDPQAVEDAPASLPARVLAFRDRGGGRDQRLPALREPSVGGGRPSPLGPRRRHAPRRAALRAQDRAGPLAERQHGDSRARRAPTRGVPDALPVGRTGARGPEPGLVDEGLDADGTPAVEAFPVVGEAARGAGQGRGRQVLRDDPGEPEVP